MICCTFMICSGDIRGLISGGSSAIVADDVIRASPDWIMTCWALLLEVAEPVPCSSVRLEGRKRTEKREGGREMLAFHSPRLSPFEGQGTNSLVPGPSSSPCASRPGNETRALSELSSFGCNYRCIKMLLLLRLFRNVLHQSVTC